MMRRAIVAVCGLALIPGPAFASIEPTLPQPAPGTPGSAVANGDFDVSSGALNTMIAYVAKDLFTEAEDDAIQIANWNTGGLGTGAMNIASAGVGELSNPSVAVDDDGSFIVVYEKLNTVDNRLEVWCYRDAVGEAPEIVRVSGAGRTAFDPVVAVDGLGFAYIAYAEDASGTSGTGGNSDLVIKRGDLTLPADDSVDPCQNGGVSFSSLGAESRVRADFDIYLEFDELGNGTVAWSEIDPVNGGGYAYVATQPFNLPQTWTGDLLAGTIATDAHVSDLAVSDEDGVTGDRLVGVLTESGSAYDASVHIRLTGSSTWLNQAAQNGGVVSELLVAGHPSGGGMAAWKGTGTESTYTLLSYANVDGSGFFEGEFSEPVPADAPADLATNPDGDTVFTWVDQGVIWFQVFEDGAEQFDFAPPQVVPHEQPASGVIVESSPGDSMVLAYAGSGEAGLSYLQEPAATPTTTVTVPRYLTQDEWQISWQADSGAPQGYFGYWQSRSLTSAPTFPQFIDLDTPTQTSVTQAMGNRPGTACARVVSYDGGLGPWSSFACTYVPFDSTFLKHSGDWNDVERGSAFSGTLDVSKKAGSTLTLKGAKGRVIALLVEKGPGYGSVKVIHKGVVLGTFSLNASSVKPGQVIKVKTYPSAKKGDLKVIVTTSTKKVVIDGVYVSP